MTRSASLETNDNGYIQPPDAPPTRGGGGQSKEEAQQEVYLVHRMTFSPLAVREMFLAQTVRSGGGLGRGGAEEEQTGAEEEEEEGTEVEVKMEGV
ncbi:hypothetical protein EYF80_052139 [Liparis tanakae]|uniref:Uncharacterized protein n=1 Tax=Liparis tanakae TaxID=230148 RepID=A0A4Z2F8W2_9TELE|nr:hypothetical protein EYF80_052139 [Liparis tanakae]